MARSFVSASSQSVEGIGSAPQTTYPLTIMGWVRPHINTASAGMIVVLCETAAVPNRWAIFAGPNAVFRLVVGDGTSATVCDTSSTYTVDTWNHFCAVLTSATDRSIYMNGANVGTSSVSRPTSSISDIKIGQHNGGNYLDGRVAEVGIWNATLDANAIAAGAAGVNPLDIQRQSLVWYAPLYGFQSPEQNVVGTHSLTLVNAPASADHAPVSLPYGASASNLLTSVSVNPGTYRGFMALG